MTTLIWHKILQINAFFYPGMPVPASFMYFWKMHSKWQIIFTQFCELFSLSSEITVNSAFHIASPAITDQDCSSPDHFPCEISGVRVQEKTAKVKTESCPQVVRLLIKGAGERKAGHLSTTKRKHSMPAGQKVCLCRVRLLQDSCHPHLGDRNKHITHIRVWLFYHNLKCSYL